MVRLGLRFGCWFAVQGWLAVGGCVATFGLDTLGVLGV